MATRKKEMKTEAFSSHVRMAWFGFHDPKSGLNFYTVDTSCLGPFYRSVRLHDSLIKLHKIHYRWTCGLNRINCRSFLVQHNISCRKLEVTFVKFISVTIRNNYVHLFFFFDGHLLPSSYKVLLHLMLDLLIFLSASLLSLVLPHVGTQYDGGAL